MKNQAIISSASTIRQMAVVMHKEKRFLTVKPLSKDETLEHLYELEVHQIEQELQIEALIQERSIAQDLSLKYKKDYEKAIDACEKYTALYDFAPSGYFTLTKEGEIIDVNLYGAQKLGKARPDLKDNLFGFFVSDDTKPFFNLFLTKIFTGKAHETCKVTLSTKGNLTIDVYLTGIVNGDNQHCNINLFDISELMQEEQELIDISKTESGLLNVHISDCNVNDQIRYLYNFFKPEVEGKGMQLFFQNSMPTKVAVIQTDSEKLLVILTTLVKNAIKYSEKGTIEFGYSLKLAGSFLEVEFFVKDTGIGISQDQKKVIFDRLIQVSKNNSNTIQGAGSGLALSKSYVEMLEGRIWIESEVGKGSTFYFTIPYNCISGAHKDTDIH